MTYTALALYYHAELFLSLFINSVSIETVKISWKKCLTRHMIIKLLVLYRYISDFFKPVI